MPNQVKFLLIPGAVILLLAFAITGCPQDTNGTTFIPPATETFTVYFDCGENANPINPQTVIKGAFLKAVEPVHGDSDYYFVGWFPETEEADRWDFELDPVTENITLVARWVNTQSVLLTITFDTNGGSTIDSLLDIRVTDGIDLSLFKPIKADYEFTGWFNYNYGGDQGIIQSINDIWARITETSTITLTAMWSRVILAGEGGSHQPANAQDIVSYFIYRTENRGIDPTLNATENLRNSVLGVQVDGPGTGSSYTGFSWQDNGNIRVLDNREKLISPVVDSDGIFQFYLHDQRDYDGSSTGRQRIEIKGSTSFSSTDDRNIKAKEDDIITYHWKFKLPEDLVNVRPAGFFHIFQIKSTVGAEAGAPLVSFTVTRDNLLFRNTVIGANMDTTEVIAAIPMNKVLDRWLAAEVTIHYRDNGYIYGKLTDLQNNTLLMREYKACDTWRRPEVKEGGVWKETPLDAPSTQLCRPKWGLYRALNAATREASMMWADMVIIKRDKDTYLFPDGRDPADAGPIPNRDFSTYWTNDLVNGLNWNGANTGGITKASISHSSGIERIFNKGNTTNWAWSSNIMNNGATTAKIPGWIAIDLGQVRKINEVFTNMQGGGDADRLDSLYISVTNDTQAWSALKSNTGSSFISAINSEVTTLDPLGVHTTDERYYTGPNPYLYADKWTHFLSIPKLSRSNSDICGLPKHIETANTFNRDQPVVDGRTIAKEVEGRYVIMYCDILNYGRSLTSQFTFSSPNSVKWYEFLIKYNPALDVDTEENDE